MNRNKTITVLFALIVSLLLSNCSADGGVVAGGATADGGVTGQAGSMARFALVKNFLYTLNEYEMILFTVDDPKNPMLFNRVNAMWDIETIFPLGDNLFIGAEGGMYIYDITEPSMPTYLSEFNHIRSCDPVVVQDSIAYVTLRSGSACWGNTDELEIVNVSDLNSPQLIASYDMTNPHGLAVDDSLLFICDGEAGVKCYNVTDPTQIKLVQHIGDMHAYDVILTDTEMIVVAEEMLVQYDRTSFPMTKLSSISIGE